MTNFRPQGQGLLLAAILSCTAGPALAEAPQISYALGAASDYVFRGVSQTNEDPFVFGSVNLAAGGFYVGAGAENVDFGNSIDFEYDLWAGWTTKLGALGLDLGLVRYGYHDQPAGVEIDTLEYKLALSHPLGPVNAGAAFFYTSDYFGSDDSGTYAELNASYSVNEQWSVSGAYGKQDVGTGLDYATWNLGLGWAASKLVSADLRYHDTDAHEAGAILDSRVVGTIKLSF